MKHDFLNVCPRQLRKSYVRRTYDNISEQKYINLQFIFFFLLVLFPSLDCKRGTLVDHENFKWVLQAILGNTSVENPRFRASRFL